MTNVAIGNGPVEIVDFPINSMVIFHSFLYVYQRVSRSEGLNGEKRAHGFSGEETPKWVTFLLHKTPRINSYLGCHQLINGLVFLGKS